MKVENANVMNYNNKNKGEKFTEKKSKTNKSTCQNQLSFCA